MCIRFFFLLLFSLFLTGCFLVPHSKSTLISTLPSQPVQQTKKIASVNQVKINGHLNVKIRTGSEPKLIIKGDSRDLAYLTIQGHPETLSIHLGKGYPRYGQVYIEIYTRYLNRFDFRGVGFVQGTINSSLLNLNLNNDGRTVLKGRMGIRQLSINGNGFVEIYGISSPALNLVIKGHPKVRMQGMVNLSRLEMKNNAALKLYWVKGDSLIVKGHNDALIELAGSVNRLDVELWDKSHFNGQYLRANRAFIKTHNKSLAEVSAVKRQHTLAEDSSDIQFYNIPQMKADFMADEGAVLDMRDLRAPFLEEYDQYNK